MTPPFVLVLTADPASGALGAAVAERVSDLAAHPARWLAPGAALDVPVDSRATRDVARTLLAGLPIDVNVVPAVGRAKKLLISDMDSTMIAQEVVDELASAAGRDGEIAAMTEATMRGEIDFKSSLRHRVGLLAGLSMDGIAAVHSRLTFMPGAAAFVAGMKESGAVTALVSGGFTVFVEPVARSLGFDRAAGNVLEISDGRLNGRVAEPILDAAAKRVMLMDLAAEADLDLSQTLAVGDGANDLAMLEAAGLGVAFRAKPAVRAAMRASPTGAVIDHGDLTALLHLQGLPAAGPDTNFLRATADVDRVRSD